MVKIERFQPSFSLRQMCVSGVILCEVNDAGVVAEAKHFRATLVGVTNNLRGIHAAEPGFPTNSKTLKLAVRS
jgi:hypothetical protein